MTKELSSPLASSAQRIKKAVSSIEPLESRAYLNGVVFGTPQNTNATTAGIAPVYVNLDNISSSTNADLIVANAAHGSVPNSVSVLPGNGDGTFGTARTVPLDFSPLTLMDGQLGTNGKIDIVVGSTSNNHVGVILQANDGTLSEQDYVATGLVNTQSVAIGDFNGDSHQDIAVASQDGGTTNNVAIFFNNGDGTFTLNQVLSVPHTRLASLTAFNGGGRIDLAVADQADNAVTVMLNDGTGHFSVGANYSVGAGPVTIKAGQFNTNNNTNDDLVTANSTGGSVSVLLGNGDGTFQSTAVTTAVEGVPAGGGPLKVRVANLNADGKPDLLGLLSAGSSGDGEVLLGNGDGTFHVGNIISTGGATRTSIAAGDLNGDGLTDLALADPTQVTALVNITNQDHTAPTAAVDITQPTPVPGAATLDFTVTYSDNTQIDATTIGSGNLTVTDPHGNTQAVTLVSTNLGNAASVTATYRINAPSGSLSTADNGTYTVTATSDTSSAVKDANGNALAGGSIGSFLLAVPTPANGPNLVATSLTSKLPASVVAGTRSKSGAKVTITNSGNATASGTIVINLYASPDQTIRGNAPLLATITKKIKLKIGKKVSFNLPKFTWPASLSGTQHLVVLVNATDAVTESSFADNTAITSNATVVAPPFVDIQNLWNSKIPKLVAGKKATLPVLLKNNGNTTAKGTVTFTIVASPDGLLSDGTALGTATANLNIGAGKKHTVPAKFTMPTLASGTYHLVLTSTFPGDTNAGNDTVVSTTTFTV